MSCERNVKLSPKISRFIASADLKKIDGKEELPLSVKEFLAQEQVAIANNSVLSDSLYAPENKIKFPLPYYLIPEQDAKFLKAASLDSRIADQLSFKISGAKHYKLFVHPKMEESYDFLRAAYNYIGTDKTEFMASPTSNTNTIMVWNRNNPLRKVFAVKINLENINPKASSLSTQDVERSIANQNVFDQLGPKKLNEMNLKIFPETAGLIITKMHPGAPNRVGVQVIREIPDDIIDNKKKWIPFSILMNSKTAGRPLLLDIISKSGLDSYHFVESYMIDNYLKMYENFSLKTGMNYVPTTNNLLLETDDELKPTGKWILRDLSKIWPDVIVMGKTDGPVEAFMQDFNASKFDLQSARARCVESYVISYRNQIFDETLETLAKYDPLLTEDKAQMLKDKINKRYTKLMHQYYGLKLKEDFGPNNFREIEKELVMQSEIDDKEPKQEIKDSENLKTFLENKKEKIEWIELAPRKEKSEFYLTNYGLYEISNKKIVGLAIFNKDERVEYDSNDKMLSALKQYSTQQTGCYQNVSSFFRSEKK